MPQTLLILAAVALWAAMYGTGFYLWWRVSKPGAATQRPMRRTPSAVPGGTAGPVAAPEATGPARPRRVVRG